MDLQHQRIRDVCAQLKLDAMAEAYPHMAARAASNELTFADFFEGLLKTEITTRCARSRTVLAKMAGFPVIKTLEEFDFTFAHGVSKKMMQELSGLAFIERAENVVLLGPSGVGKTHLAISLGYLSTQAGYKTRFISADDLVIALVAAQRQERLPEFIRRNVMGPSLLVIDDDWLPAHEPGPGQFVLPGRGQALRERLHGADQQLTVWPVGSSLRWRQHVDRCTARSLAASLTSDPD